MYCKNCGKEIEEGTKFCSNCGVSLSEVSNSNNTQQKNEKQAKEKKNISILGAILIIIIFLTLVGAITANNVSQNQIQEASTGALTDNIENVTNESTKNYITLGQTVENKDWNITIQNVYFGQRIDPPNKEMFYNYYQVDDTNDTYLCLILDAQNMSSLELSAEKVATVKAKYDNTYTYSSFSAIPDKTLGFTYTNIVNIKPLTTDSIYYLIKMPKTAEDDISKPIEIEIKCNNNTYYYQYR